MPAQFAGVEPSDLLGPFLTAQYERARCFSETLQAICEPRLFVQWRGQNNRRSRKRCQLCSQRFVVVPLRGRESIGALKLFDGGVEIVDGEDDFCDARQIRYERLTA